MNLWEIVTSNSTLPIQQGTTFWDHINNQKVGTGSGLPYPVPVTISGVDNMFIETCADVGLINNEADVTLLKTEGLSVNIHNEGENN